MRRYLIEKKNRDLVPRRIHPKHPSTEPDPIQRMLSDQQRGGSLNGAWSGRTSPGRCRLGQARAGLGQAVHEVNLKVVHGQIFVSVSFGAEIFGAVFVKMPPKIIFGRAEIFFGAATFFERWHGCRRRTRRPGFQTST